MGVYVTTLNILGNICCVAYGILLIIKKVPISRLVIIIIKIMILKIWMFCSNLIRAEKATLVTKNSGDLAVCMYHQLEKYPIDSSRHSFQQRTVMVDRKLIVECLC